ncbi:uncharacterized protein BDZ99DRAFT_519822 [Mytilinidion resinicola]|uniref:Uncharacterized protein n=1 Tax=Mytilinidion resinicola TaxID=574789 RepID=A0A6A6YQX5_9PEZI|nr:uncharacterized protein BDZ99DRAFT_519822 [Mytilinidion resinicola]KAF2811161.1 hypothetical protein BDZ99DRAFT_519822 [Mytilinidion resinicola]
MPSRANSPSSIASADSLVDIPQVLHVPPNRLREAMWLRAPPAHSARRTEGSFLPDNDVQRAPCDCRIPALFPLLVATPDTPEAPLRVVLEGDPDAIYQVVTSLCCPHVGDRVVFSFHLAGSLHQTNFEALWDAGWQGEANPMLFRVSVDTVNVYKIVREELVGVVVPGTVTVREFVGACFLLEDEYAELLEEEADGGFDRALLELAGEEGEEEEREEEEEMVFLTEEEEEEWRLEMEME